jgi:hypothetical protein
MNAAISGTRPVPGAELAAVSGQQARHEHRQWQRNVKDDTIRQHAEPPVVAAGLPDRV